MYAFKRWKAASCTHHCNITQKQPLPVLLASQSASHQMHLQNAETEACR